VSDEVFRLTETRVSFSATERRRRAARGVMLGGVGLAVLSGAIMVVANLGLFAWCMLVGLAVAGVSAIISGGGGVSRIVGSAGSVSIDGERILVTVEGERAPRAFPLADVAEGWLEAPGRAVLRMRDGYEVVIDVPDDETGQRLLELTGVGANARVMRVALASAASRVPGGEIVGVLGLLLLTPLAVMLLASLIALSLGTGHRPMNVLWWAAMVVVPASVLLAIVVGLFRFMRSRQVVVGTDGVVFRGALWKRFVPYKDIARVRRHSHGVLLGLKRGKRFLLPVRAAILRGMPLQPPRTVARANAAVLDENLVRREILFRRIEEARASRGGSSAVRLDLERLDQKEKPFSAWLEEMRRLVSERGGYREGRVLPDDLAAVVEDPGAPPERRIGAAVALSRADDEGARRRIRIAVEACADLELRAALEEAAHGEIAEARVTRLRKRFGE